MDILRGVDSDMNLTVIFGTEFVMGRLSLEDWIG